MASFQKVFIVDDKYDANAKAYLVEDKYNADIVGRVVDNINEADMKVYIVEEKYDANIRLCLESRNESSGCFLSTACVEFKGLPDDCYQLTVLRKFRDEYLASTSQGRDIINEYYQIAPLILKEIEKTTDSDRIYNYLYDTLVENSINYIEINKMDQAKTNYITIVNSLKQTYLNPLSK